MKKLYINGSNSIVFDPEKDIVEEAPYTRTSIRDVLLVKEPMQLIFEKGDTKVTENVDVDDIVVVFYNGTFEKNMTIVKGNDVWINNLKKYEAEEQKRKEEWAAKQANNCDGCCGEIPCCEAAK